MLLTLILIILIICFVLLLHIILSVPSYRTYHLVNKIHGPKGYPILGIALEVASLDFNELLGYFRKVQNEFPRISLIWLLGKPLVLCNDPNDLAEIFGNTVNLDKGFEYSPLRAWLKEGLLVSSGKKWHSRRKLLTPTFHFKILEASLTSMQKHADKLVNKMIKLTNQPIDLHEVLTLCSLDIICEIAMGIQLGSQENPTTEYFQSVKRISEIIVTRAKSIHLQRDWLFNLTPQGREYKKLLKFVHNFTRKIIKVRKNEYLKETNKILPNNINNQYENEFKSKIKHKAFLDALIEVENVNRLTDEDIQEEVDTFLFEGHDTTSSALTFTTFCLGLYQDIQTKVVEELNGIFNGENRPITMQDLNNMKYLEQFIKETLRLYPSVPYISRKLCKDIVLKDGIIIPAGANTILLPHYVHRKPDLYPDPEKFDPERFSPENINLRHPYSYLPFSAGPRNCIGQKFAMMEIKMVLATMLRSFKIEPITKSEDVKVLPLLILRTVEPIYAKVKLRN